jgi:hypothetical protein
MRSKACAPEGLSCGLAFLSTAKRSVNSEPLVGQHGVDGEREAGEKALEEAGCGDGAAIGQDLEIDKAGGAIDGDPGLAPGQAPA